MERDGTLDRTFLPTGDFEAAHVIRPLADGTLLIGGEFEREHRIGGILSNPQIGFPETGLIRLNSDGSLAREFGIAGKDFPKSVWEMAVQSDGKILVAGHIDTNAGAARLFGPSLNKPILCCAAVTNGSIMFEIKGNGWHAALIEASPNLTSWNRIQSIQLDSVSPFRFDAKTDTNFLRRFYRISALP